MKKLLLIVTILAIYVTAQSQVPKEENEEYYRLTQDKPKPCDCKPVVKRPVTKPVTSNQCCPTIVINNNTQPIDYKHYYPDPIPVDNSRWDVVAIVMFLILLALLLWMLLKPPGAAAYYAQQAQNHYNPPGINIHVHGSHACSDSSESVYNRESYYYKEDSTGAIRKIPIPVGDEIKSM